MNLGADPAPGGPRSGPCGWLLRRSPATAPPRRVADVAAFETSDDPDAEFSGGVLDSNPYVDRDRRRRLRRGRCGRQRTADGRRRRQRLGDRGLPASRPTSSRPSCWRPWARRPGRKTGGHARRRRTPTAKMAKATAPKATEVGHDARSPSEVGAHGRGRRARWRAVRGRADRRPVPGRRRLGAASRAGRGADRVYATGFSNIMDIGFGPDGTLYVAEIVHDGLMGVFTAMRRRSAPSWPSHPGAASRARGHRRAADGSRRPRRRRRRQRLRVAPAPSCPGWRRRRQDHAVAVRGRLRTARQPRTGRPSTGRAVAPRCRPLAGRGGGSWARARGRCPGANVSSSRTSPSSDSTRSGGSSRAAGEGRFRLTL